MTASPCRVAVGLAVLLLAVGAVVGAQTDRPETVSLLGAPLYSPPPTDSARAAYHQALADFDKSPTEDAWIWLGRRAAYLGRYREAVRIFSDGLARFPQSYWLLRHRGHRYITLREFRFAIDDLERAAILAKGQPLEIEPDGAPNKAGVPVSNTHFNIYYHLGLAYYLVRDFPKAEQAYRACLTWSKNDDSVVAVSDWLYMTLRRLGKSGDAARVLAPVHRGMTLLENGAYLDRLLLFKGEIAETAFAAAKADESPSEQAIRAYGMGMSRLWADDRAGARSWFQQLVLAGSWPSFATIAAEAELVELARR